MTEAATTRTIDPVIKLDTTTKYNINAGKCDHCGNFKTWDFRVQNQKSGKMMPGHVNKDGFKINDGDCPYWTAMRNKKRTNGGNSYPGTIKTQPTNVNHGTTMTTSQTQAIMEQQANYGQIQCTGDRTGTQIRVSTNHPILISLNRDESLKLARELIDKLL
ncbi:MAG: hypothetical protein ACTSUE_22725 [Promethearchaeota archaeon]